MKSVLMSELVLPLSRRLGTMAATAVVTYGASEGVATHVEGLVAMAFTALCGVAFDLLNSARSRKGAA